MPPARWADELVRGRNRSAERLQRLVATSEQGESLTENGQRASLVLRPARPPRNLDRLLRPVDGRIGRLGVESDLRTCCREPSVDEPLRPSGAPAAASHLSGPGARARPAASARRSVKRRSALANELGILNVRVAAWSKASSLRRRASSRSYSSL